jgi:hypothetical protein
MYKAKREALRNGENQTRFINSPNIPTCMKKLFEIACRALQTFVSIKIFKIFQMKPSPYNCRTSFHVPHFSRLVSFVPFDVCRIWILVHVMASSYSSHQSSWSPCSKRTLSWIKLLTHPLIIIQSKPPIDPGSSLSVHTFKVFSLIEDI